MEKLNCRSLINICGGSQTPNPNMPTVAIAPGGINQFFISASVANGLPTGSQVMCNIGNGGTDGNRLIDSPGISNLGGPIGPSPGIPHSNIVYNGDLNAFCTSQVSALLTALGGSLPPPPYPAIH